MPKRVIDFDAMWGSDKLASCAEWAQAEYAWLYGLADASGCFEVTNLRVIWGRVAAIRRNLTIERLEQVFGEFQDKGLLFIWEHEGKRYGHWTGSDVPGRLPPPSWRMRLEKLAPPVPKQQFAAYVSRFARGRAALPGGGFRVEVHSDSHRTKYENSDLKSHSVSAASGYAKGTTQQQTDSNQPISASLKSQIETKREDSDAGRGLHALDDGLEECQAQDWNWDRNLEGKKDLGSPDQGAAYGEMTQQGKDFPKPLFFDSDSNPKAQTSREQLRGDRSQIDATRTTRAAMAGAASEAHRFQPRDKSFFVARELAVGQGPCCGPVKVKPEVLERIRARNASRDGTRSP